MHSYSKRNYVFTMWSGVKDRTPYIWSQKYLKIKIKHPFEIQQLISAYFLNNHKPLTCIVASLTLAAQVLSVLPNYLGRFVWLQYLSLPLPRLASPSLRLQSSDSRLKTLIVTLTFADLRWYCVSASTGNLEGCLALAPSRSHRRNLCKH